MPKSPIISIMENDGPRVENFPATTICFIMGAILEPAAAMYMIYENNREDAPMRIHCGTLLLFFLFSLNYRIFDNKKLVIVDIILLILSIYLFPFVVVDFGYIVGIVVNVTALYSGDLEDAFRGERLGGVCLALASFIIE